MAQIEIWYEQDLQKQVPVHKLDFVFNEDSQANKIGVKLYDNGEALSSVSGSVTGYFLLADGTTTSISGSKSGNMVSVVVPPAAYKVTGPITITIRVTDGSNITTVCACVGAVMLSKTPVATPAGSTVSDWSAQISAQLQACQDASDNVGATLAVPYASLTFPVTAGTYTYYDGGVYYANQDISSSEEWTSDHWTQTKVFDEIADLKSDMEALDASKADKNNPRCTGSIVVGAGYANGEKSSAFGNGVSVSGDYAHGEGNNTTASGESSHAEGRYVTAGGMGSHAEGQSTNAHANFCHAEGDHTKAWGTYSHVGGKYNIQDSYDNARWPEWVANRQYSVGDKVKITTSTLYGNQIEGYVCKTANSDAEFTSSKWTAMYGQMNYAEIIGNGTADNRRSNARTLDWSGNEELAGDLTINKGTANEVSVSELKSAIDSIFALMQANGWNIGT